MTARSLENGEAYAQRMEMGPFVLWLTAIVQQLRARAKKRMSLKNTPDANKENLKVWLTQFAQRTYSGNKNVDLSINFKSSI